MPKTLLTLPTEIQNHIWKLSFADLNVTPETYFHPDRQVAYRDHCNPCSKSTLQVHQYNNALKPLLTCKHIWTGANSVFYSSMNVHLSDYNVVSSIIQKRPVPLQLGKLENLIIYLHIGEENRAAWSVALLELLHSCTKLRNLTVHNHMRPPLQYDHLNDAVYFVAPLILAKLPQRGIKSDIKYDYAYEDVMFTSPPVGNVACSDALPEHSLVVRDLIADDGFAGVANVDWNEGENESAMKAILVRIARSYEQGWFQRLQRRRTEEVARSERERNQPGETGGIALEGE